MNDSANDQEELLDTDGLLTPLLFFTDGLLSFRTEEVVLLDSILIRTTIRLILISTRIRISSTHVFYLLIIFEFE